MQPLSYMKKYNIPSRAMPDIVGDLTRLQALK